MEQVVQPTNIKGVFVIMRSVYPDDRGSFQEVFRLSELETAVGEQIIIRQINKSVSKSGVLRGLHIAPWGKLVYCYTGSVYQVVVDARKNSPTYAEVFTCEIGGTNPKAVWVPSGCANGFCVTSKEDAIYGYSVTAEFQAGREIGLLWNDQKIFSKINWPIKDPILSEKDKIGLSFNALP